MRAQTTVSLAVFGVFLASLLAAGGGGREPYHDHIVVGGTPTERARALAAHLRGEVPGGAARTEIPDDGAPAFAGGSAHAHVFSVAAPDGSGPAVFSGGGSVAFLAQAPIRWAPPASQSLSSPDDDTVSPRRDLSTSDPPPRPA